MSCIVGALPLGLVSADLARSSSSDTLEQERDSIMGKIEILVEQHPQVFARTYKLQMLRRAISPLAALCVLGAPQKLIELVFDLRPAAANDAASVECHFAKNVDLLQFLCDKSPAVMTIPDPATGELPLQIACQGDTTLDVVRFVHDAYPQALTHKDKYFGRTPIHDAFCYPGVPIIAYLMERSNNNAVLQQKCTGGFTPLHLAFHNERKKVSCSRGISHTLQNLADTIFTHQILRSLENTVDAEVGYKLRS